MQGLVRFRLPSDGKPVEARGGDVTEQHPLSHRGVECPATLDEVLRGTGAPDAVVGARQIPAPQARA
ncbi:hypothetical protein J2Y42_002665 [Leifsonia sp. 1010]|nr:hypothetical protein [Leifsonia sp. 1010]